MATADGNKLPNPKSRWIERLDDKPQHWLEQRLTHLEELSRQSTRGSEPRNIAIRALRVRISAMRKAETEPAAVPSSAAFAPDEDPAPVIVAVALPAAAESVTAPQSK